MIHESDFHCSKSTFYDVVCTRCRSMSYLGIMHAQDSMGFHFNSVIVMKQANDKHIYPKLIQQPHSPYLQFPSECN